MTNTFRGLYDGKFIVPDAAVDLPANEELIVHVRPASPKPRGIPGSELRGLAGTISSKDAEEMMKAIEEGCGRVDLSEW